MTKKVDFKKTLKELYQPSAKEVVVVNVPEMQFIMIDGMGSPGEAQEYMDAIASLYPVAFKTKFRSKEKGKDYVVPPLEGLWWAEDMSDFLNAERDKWQWTMMIMQPKWVTQTMIKNAIKSTQEKTPDIPDSISKLRLDKYIEGTCAQILHIGPYSEEGPTIEKLHAFIEERGGTFDGHQQKHHEIYLSDPRRVKPEKMKTVIRQPFG